MPTTSNFGWTTPADTDLVKDGAAAIRTLGSGIDTSLVDLKGGTTGQVLSKATNTDLDYTWTTPNVGDITEVQAGTGISVASGTGPIPVVTNSMATEITAKGDLIVGTGSGSFDNLPAGTNGYTLVADSTETTGLKWGGGWTTWTPSYTNLTVGNGTVVSRYRQVGKMVDVYYRLTLGSTSTIGSDPRFTLPVNFNQYQNPGLHFYTGSFLDSGTRVWGGGIELRDTQAYFQYWNTSLAYIAPEGVTATVPFTWTTNDSIQVQFSYEVA
jgi:hypothetical protein